MNEQEQVESVSPADGDDAVSSTQPEVLKLSKNQQKKLRKLEKRQQFQMVKRQRERERKKEKRKLEAAEGIFHPSRKKLRRESKHPVDITVVIDASFEEHMVENDIRKLTKQIQHCYAINRRAPEPFKYYVTSYGGLAKNIIETQQSGSRWDVTWCAESYEETFPCSNIVYLAAESENVLESVDIGKVYVIGGLVDHNSKKGLCYKLAVEKGIAHARLPISEHIQMECRKVLTIDHVFGILQKFYETKDWEAAFFSVIPKRKGAQSINSSSAPDQASQVELMSDIEDGSDSPSNLHSHGDNLVAADATAVVSSSPDDATKTTTMRGETTSQYICENAEFEDELTIVTGCADTVLVKDGDADGDTVDIDCADTVLVKDGDADSDTVGTDCADAVLVNDGGAGSATVDTDCADTVLVKDGDADSDTVDTGCKPRVNESHSHSKLECALPDKQL
ncbi:tRNA methyltransferase 10 homolog A-like [Watersipora subatra]|uniref:tRNA methyltransferase 10 homolog A-like n=1 Tax=Watersipora subatra TaxID=2589382 RepID=UPI00355BC560